MKFISVCSGIEAASCAWNPLGWEAFSFAEIEKFPSAVLAHHYPGVPNFGDMSKFMEWPNAAIDLLVGGTPCQSFSVAGLRKGLDDPRGNLMLTYLAIARRYRPRWLVWENVPGVLSSGRGRDFAALLRGLDELGYGWAYRVLDAQYFGVAQRRRRVFVVGHLGDWRRAAAVLFERHSLQGHPAPRREAGENIAQTIRAGSANNSAGHGARSGDSKDELIVPVPHAAISPALKARDSKGASSDGDGDGAILVPMMTFHPTQDPISSPDVCHSIGANNNATAAAIFGIPGNWIGRAPENGGNAVEPMIDISPCQTKTDRHGVAVVPAIGWSEELTAHVDIGATLQRGGDGGRHDGVMTPSMQVRRLTPVECERLQGFPDNYTQIPWRGKPTSQCPDGPRYKALGNSMAVPVMRWIGERIQIVERINTEKAAA